MIATDRLIAMLDERGVEYVIDHEYGEKYPPEQRVTWSVDLAGEDMTVTARDYCIGKDDSGECDYFLDLGFHEVFTPEQAIDATLGPAITGETSDGYHTFDELYHHRAVLFSVIVADHPDISWKSKLHHDGTIYDGMFIVGIETPEGQATYHYNIDPYWEMFKCKELERAPEWDGHTPDDAIARIATLPSSSCTNGERTNGVCHDVNVGGHFVCSECEALVELHDIGRSYVDEFGKRWYSTSNEHGLNYCPNCGARIENDG